MIEIQNLAVAIRDTAALDAGGIVAATLAEDLADINPELMPTLFITARKRFKWLPKPVEMLDLYAEVVKTAIAHADALKQAADRDREEALRRDRDQHPEKYFTLGQVVAGVPGAADFVAGLEKRDWQAKAQQAAHDNAPKIEDCPNCGFHLPLRVADLRGLTIEDHEAYIEAKRRYAAQHDANVAAAKCLLLNAIADAHEQDAEAARKVANAKARLAGAPPTALPKKPRRKKASR